MSSQCSRPSSSCCCYHCPRRRCRTLLSGGDRAVDWLSQRDCRRPCTTTRAMWLGYDSWLPACRQLRDVPRRSAPHSCLHTTSVQRDLPNSRIAAGQQHLHVSYTFQWAAVNTGICLPQKCPFPQKSWTPLIYGGLEPCEPDPKQDHGRFNRFCRVHQCGQHLATRRTCLTLAALRSG